MKSVHLRGFIRNKFVTIHGNINVKIYGKASPVSIKEEKERNFKLTQEQDLAQSLLRYKKNEDVWGSGVRASRNLNPETRSRR